MEINDKLIDKLGELSRLRFEGKDREAIKADLERVIRFVDKLGELDTSAVEPLIYMTDEPLELREDKVVDELPQKEALKNAPAHDSDYFKAPKVLDK